jgi:hypothetical protein
LPEVAAMMVLAMAGFRFRGDHGAFRGGERSEATIASDDALGRILAGLLCGLSARAISAGAGPSRIVAAARTEQTDPVFSLVSKPVRCS